MAALSSPLWAVDFVVNDTDDRTAPLSVVYRGLADNALVAGILRRRLRYHSGGGRIVVFFIHWYILQHYDLPNVAVFRCDWRDSETMPVMA